MHRFRDPHAQSRLITVSFLEWLKWVVALCSLCLLVRGVLHSYASPILLGGEFAGLAVLVQVLVFAIGRHTQCPLCMTPILGNASCAKHRRVRSILGNHRLKVAWDVLSSRQLICPYCNERTELTSRSRFN